MRNLSNSANIKTVGSLPNLKIWVDISLLLLLLFMAGKRLVAVFPAPGALNGDAYWAYLPSANKLLKAPWSFLTTDPASYHVAPLGYIWPALFGADQFSIQLANCILFLASIVLFWCFIRQIGGSIAAFVASAILIGHPDIRYHAAQVLTESLYFFGFTLALFAIVQAMANKKSRTQWLFVMAFGLTITLLTRPVLQYILLLAIIFTITQVILNIEKKTAWIVSSTLILSFAVPSAFILKNGVFFDFWGISSGSGSGLLYGLSPYKNGAEPLYSNFSYDADVIPYHLDPENFSSVLNKQSNQINQKTAIEILKNTKIPDNFYFFQSKLYMWLFSSTPELYINPKLRWFRISEWLIITLSIILFITRRKASIANSSKITPINGLSLNKKLFFYIGVLFGCFLMAFQLLPVLYNTRYSSYFIEPWLMILTGLSTSYIISGHAFRGRKTWHIIAGMGSIILLIYLSYTLTQHAVRREIWEVNPDRPGPTAVIVPASQHARLNGQGMSLNPNGSWLITSSPATLQISLKDIDVPSHEQMRDALWRMRFALQIPTAKPMAQCGKATLSVTPHQENINWHAPSPLLFVRTDAIARNYMISANGESRPKGQFAQVSLTFNCPAGSVLTWHGIELRKSTLADAALEFFVQGTPIDPYLRDPMSTSPVTPQD